MFIPSTTVGNAIELFMDICMTSPPSGPPYLLEVTSTRKLLTRLSYWLLLYPLLIGVRMNLSSIGDIVRICGLVPSRSRSEPVQCVYRLEGLSLWYWVQYFGWQKVPLGVPPSWLSASGCSTTCGPTWVLLKLLLWSKWKVPSHKKVKIIAACGLHEGKWDQVLRIYVKITGGRRACLSIKGTMELLFQSTPMLSEFPSLVFFSTCGLFQIYKNPSLGGEAVAPLRAATGVLLCAFQLYWSPSMTQDFGGGCQLYKAYHHGHPSRCLVPRTRLRHDPGLL